MNEKKLAERLSGGDAKALEAIIRGYSGYVCTVAFNLSRGLLTNEDIDDIIQDVFFRLWEARERLDARLGLRSYLSAMVRNAVKSYLKNKPRFFEDISELELSDGFLVENIAELNDMTACIYEGLRKLREKERTVFFRYYFYGESASQIAKTLGLNESAVCMRLSRARQKLRAYLKERGYDYV